VAVDALAVFVHKDNPIKGLTLQQVDAIFSKTSKGGLAKEIKTWGDLGLTGEWADKPISLYGRNSASGTYGYFKEVALFKGDYKDQVKEQPGSSAVIQVVASDKYAIGYSGVGYKTADVKTVPLALKEGQTCYDADAKNAYSGDYPLARFLYIYMNKNNQALTPRVHQVCFLQGSKLWSKTAFTRFPAKSLATWSAGHQEKNLWVYHSGFSKDVSLS
jgi:phosphate transport system substrate-binding protein